MARGRNTLNHQERICERSPSHILWQMTCLFLLFATAVTLACQKDDTSARIPATKQSSADKASKQSVKSSHKKKNPPATSPAPTTALPPTASGERPKGSDQIQVFCRQCHPFTDPNILPRFAWPQQIETMYDLFRTLNMKEGVPPKNEVMNYFLSRAPTAFPAKAAPTRPAKDLLTFDKIPYSPPGAPPTPAVSSLELVNHFKDPAKELLVSDLRHQQVFIIDINDGQFNLIPVADIPFPAQSSLLDVNSDGVNDIIVAGLGSFGPSDDKKGAVFLVPGLSETQFGKPIELASNLGRVPDIQYADLDQDGDQDIVVSEFGKWQTGSVFALENTGVTPAGEVTFRKRPISSAPGCLKTQVGDFNNDGVIDVAALFAQGREEVIVFLHNKAWGFDEVVANKAPHPAWGYNDLRAVDLDADGDLDLVTVNGDMMDDSVVKPYHSVSWHENQGRFPFKRHALYTFPGAGQVEVADLDKDGLLDIVATGFSPMPHMQIRVPRDFQSIVALRQVSKGRFEAFSIERHSADHAALTIGDIDNNGAADIIVGNFAIGPTMDGSLRSWVNIFRQ